MRSAQQIRLLGRRALRFVERDDLLFFTRALPFHANGLRFIAQASDGSELVEKTYYSVGGGFVVSEDVAADGSAQKRIAPDTTILPLPFHSGDELLEQCRGQGLSIAQVMRANERHWRSDAEIDDGLHEIWQVMQACVARGLATDGVLPGGLKVKRRAAEWHRKLAARDASDPLALLDWVNLWALAVNEENAAGGRVVTAPTNGAAGIIPSVLHYYARAVPGADDAGIVDFLLTAGAIGILYKENASISGRRSRLPGRGRRRLLDGRGCARRGDGRNAGAGRECGRDRHGASPGPDLRSGRWPRADSVHRAQRDRLGQGH